MPEFFVAYHGGKKPETPEAGMEGMKKWKDWATALGPALTTPGAPVGVTQVLTADGLSAAASPHPLMGFSIVAADDMQAALDLLKDCPHLHYFGGTLEISEMMPMPDQHA